ncbi:MAG: hypothetical protein ACP5XB_13945 [Isosphaeraceae bacterium]
MADANAPLAAGRHATAISTGIYAIEILLKAKICRLLALAQLPRIFGIHDLYGLATMAGLRQKLDDPVFKNTNVGQNWSRVLKYSQQLDEYRYKPDSRWSRQDAIDLLTSLQDQNKGVMPWIQKQT